MPQDDGAAARRRARGSWPIRVFRLGEEPGGDLSGSTTPEERIAMMWPLAADAWAAAGRRIPAYDTGPRARARRPAARRGPFLKR